MYPFIPAALAEETQEAAETVAKADPTWLQDLVSKFGKTPGTTWVAVGVILALGVILLVVSRSSKKWTAKTIAFAALSIALSFILPPDEVIFTRELFEMMPECAMVSMT